MENKENPLPPDFEPVQDDDIKNEDCIFEVFKSENYAKVLPNLIKAIDDYIYYYNYDRIKVKLKGLSPVNYRLQSSN